VNPKTGRALAKKVKDAKTGGLKANKTYEELFTDESRATYGRGTVAQAVREAQSYESKAAADAAAQAARDEAGPQHRGAVGGAKAYYFNRDTGKPGQKKHGPDSLGPFSSKLDASMAAFDAGLIKKKPTVTHRADNRSLSAQRYMLLGEERNKAGVLQNKWAIAINSDGQETLVYKKMREHGDAAASRLYTNAEKAAIRAEKSSSARGVKAQPSEGEIQALVREAIAAGVKAESAQKAASGAGRSAAQRAASVRLLMRKAESGSGSDAKAPICLQRLVDGKVSGQPVVILKADGTLGAAALKIANEYQRSKGNKAPKGGWSDRQVRDSVKAAVNARLYQQVFGTSEKSKCILRGEATMTVADL